MELVDRNKLCDALEDALGFLLAQDERYIDAGMYIATDEHIRDVILQQPIAYDVNKVVKISISIQRNMNSTGMQA